MPELELTAITLQHEATGAQHLHIDREDSNNVFAVGFHTPVSNDTGVPHILVRTYYIILVTGICRLIFIFVCRSIQLYVEVRNIQLETPFSKC